MRLPPSRVFTGWLALVLAAHFHGSIAPCAQAQSLLPDQPPQDGPILLHSPTAATDHSLSDATEFMTYGFISSCAGLPNDPGANDNSASKQRPGPYDSQRLLAPNFDDDDAGDSSTGNELTVNGVRMGEVQRVYQHSPLRKHTLNGDDLSLEPGQEQPEHYHWRGLLAQSAFGATIVRYRTSPRDPSYIWIWQGGPVFRF